MYPILPYLSWHKIFVWISKIKIQKLLIFETFSPLLRPDIFLRNVVFISETLSITIQMYFFNDLILCLGEKSLLRRTELFWNRSNPEGREELSWDEYRARQYGFLTGIKYKICA